MANASFIFGLRYLGTINGGPATGGINKYIVPASDATALFVGDAVKSAGTATTDGIPTITQAAAGNNIRGVVIGFEPDPDNLTLTYRPASTLRTVLVCDDPWAIFEIQSNGTGVATDMAANADLTVGSGSTITGLSGMQLDEATVTSSSAQLRILRVYPVLDNALGASVKYVVMINEHELKTTSGV